MSTQSIVQEKIDIKQRKILTSLFDSNGQKFSELSKSYEPEDRFSYHLEHLLNKRLINKRDNKYYITSDGVIKCSYLDFKTCEELHLKKTTFNFIIKLNDKFLIIEKKEKGTGIKYLLPGDRALFGVRLSEHISEVLQKKYGIKETATYRCAVNFVQYASTGKVFFDDIVLVYQVDLTEQPSKEKGLWLTLDELSKLEDVHPLIKQLILEDNKTPFLEIEIHENFNFDEEDV